MIVETQPYGSWKSPISSDLLAESALRFGQIDVDNSTFYYIEGRPSEKGRCALMQGSLKDPIKELLPKEFNVRSTVHEYGGKCFLAHNGCVYFVNHQDQDLYKINKEGIVSRITKEPTLRFADLAIANDASFLYAVAERHLGDSVDNMLMKISLTDSHIESIANGYDFYAAPRISTSGRYVAWFCWNHPNMPWDGTELWLASISPEGTLIDPKCIAGGSEESITAPSWSEADVLYFISDCSGFWNFYRYVDNSAQALYPCDIDFGSPHWIFGSERYCFLKGDIIATIGTTRGRDSIYLLDSKKQTLITVETPFTAISDLYSLNQESLLFTAASPCMASALVALDLKTNQTHIIKHSQNTSIQKDYLSFPEEIIFKTEEGLDCYGFYYPPTNPDFKSETKELPPLILRCHSGPTANASPKLNLDILYFTSRGFAFFELNYGGSTGYGREYRNRLRNNWGVVDVQDCVHAALELCKRGLVDKTRLIVKGSSAGGYTALSLLTFTDVFQAGACYYGVSDMEALAKDTHKFELHYLDRLIGPYPQERNTYIKRSPIHFVDQLLCPIIFFQGANDKVVLPSQTESMYLELRKKHIPTAYLLFENESHGFRMSSTIKRCVDAELFFYSKIFKLSLKDPVPSIKTD